MTALKVLIAAAVLLALCAAPAEARTDAENTHCLAVGMTLTKMGGMEAEIVTMLKENIGAGATQEDKDTLKQLDELATTTTTLGNGIEQLFAKAAPPSETELAALDKVNMDELTAQAEKCLQ